MKSISGLRILSFVAIVFLTNPLFSQESECWTFELEGIKVDFPFEEVSQKDTIIKGVQIEMLYANYENSALIFQKQLIGNDTAALPYNHESLINYYNEYVEGMNNYIDAAVEKEEIKHRDFSGVKAIFTKDARPYNESNIFVVENHVMMITYYNLEPFNNEVKDRFLSSLNFGDLRPVSQTMGESIAYRQGRAFGTIVFYGILALGLFFIFRRLIYK
jgi:hypothetical protein